MSFFGALVRTVVNTATLPVSLVKDVVTLGGACTDEESAVVKNLRLLKEEAESDTDKDD
jgi:hypothetical protein